MSFDLRIFIANNR